MALVFQEGDGAIRGGAAIKDVPSRKVLLNTASSERSPTSASAFDMTPVRDFLRDVLADRVVEIEDATVEVIAEWFCLWLCLKGGDCTDWVGVVV